MVVQTPKYLYTAPRVYTKPQDLPETDANGTFPSDARLVVYPATGLPQMLSQQQTAAFRDFLLGSTTPLVTITALTFTSAGSIAANSPVGTVLGTLSYTTTGGALVNPVYSLVTNAGGKVKAVGNQVQLALGNVAQGNYAFRARIAADNATAIEQELSVTIAAVATPPTITGITLTLAGSVTANSAAETLVGTLAAQTTGGALVNPAWTLVNTAGGDFKVTGGTSGVRFAVNNVPAGTFTIRAQVTSDNVAAFQQDLAFTVAAAAPPIVGAGEGLDFDFGFNRAATLAIPNMGFKAVDAMPSGEISTKAFNFARGDVPPGYRLYGELPDGSRIPLQQDLEGTFTVDGSLETCAITEGNTVARAAGTEVLYTLKAELGAPDRTPCWTHAQILAALANVKVQVSGYAIGGTPLEFSPAWVMQNCKEWTAADPGWNPNAASNPIGGWMKVLQGPLVVGYYLFGYYRDPASGQSHKWYRCDGFIRRLASGRWDFGFVNRQSNTFNAHSAGTIGTARQERIECIARIMDGATLIRSFGDVNDPNTITRPLSAITNRAEGNIDFGPGAFSNDVGGQGLLIAINGADLPADVTAGQTMGHLHYVDGGPILSVKRMNPGAGRVTFGSGGSGNISFTPLVTTWAQSSAPLYSKDGQMVSYGGTAPRYLPIHNESYLMRRAKVLPPMNEALPRVNMPNQALQEYFPGQYMPFFDDMGTAGNDNEADRIGQMTGSSAASMMNPRDPARLRRVLVNSLGWMNYRLWSLDEASGTEITMNRGPYEINDGVTTYPGMGPVMKDWTNYVGDGSRSYGSPNDNPPAARGPGIFFANKWSEHYGESLKFSAMATRYAVMVDASHHPNHCQAAWLKTGDYQHLLGLRASAAGVYGDTGETTVDGKTSRMNSGGGRIWAWAHNSLSVAHCHLPDSDPVKAMFGDILTHEGLFYSKVGLPNHPGRFVGLTLGPGSTYMMGYAHMVCAMEVLRGKFAGYDKVLEAAAIWAVDQYDDAFGPIPNGAWQFGAYGNDADGREKSPGSYWPSLAAFKMGTPQYGSPPYPSTGFRDGNPGLTYTARAEMNVLRLMTTAHAMGVVEIPRAKAVEAALFARGLTLGSGYNEGKLTPLWDLVGYSPPPATVLPNVVTDFATSYVESTAATVTWKRPTTGGPVFTYRVEVKKGSAAYVTAYEDLDDRKVNLTGLAANATNIVRITAKNPAGISTASATMNVVTPVQITGAVTGPNPAAVQNSPAAFSVSASAYPVWVNLYRGIDDVGSRVQVNAAGIVNLTPTIQAAHTARLYTKQTGGLVIQETALFTPDPPVSPYNFTWKVTEVYNGQDPHNCTANTAYKLHCTVAKKSDGTPADGEVKFVFCPAGTDPVVWPYKDTAALYQEGGDHVFFKDQGANGYPPGTSDLWVLTADGFLNKDPSGVYVRT